MNEVFLAGATRTPIASFQGHFSEIAAPKLGGLASKAAIADSGISPGAIDEVIMGCVLSAGLGQAPARQSAFQAGLDEDVPATTLNKMCGSGMKSIMIAADQVAMGRSGSVLAGGMESMTNAPYLLSKYRGGARLGHGEVKDSMFLDGLEDAYEPGRLMGTFAEDCAEKYQFSRAEQDDYAIRSLDRALDAQSTGKFEREIVVVEGGTRRNPETVTVDEQPQRARPDNIRNLKPAFREGGTVTAANSSSISDGAAAVVVTGDRSKARAQIVGHASHAQAPGWFTTAPVFAAKKLLSDIGWSVDDVDLWEVNEAFAVVPMAFMRELGLGADVVNVHGGACALGHPIGASGARIVVTLLNALESRGLKRGVAAICIGGGEGTALAIELI